MAQGTKCPEPFIIMPHAIYNYMKKCVVPIKGAHSLIPLALCR